MTFNGSALVEISDLKIRVAAQGGQVVRPCIGCYYAAKLGSGKELVERLTNLIAIFENPALDFSKNRAEGDDILGDAYEYSRRS